MSGDKKEDFSSFQISNMPGFGPGAPTRSTPAPSAPPVAQASSAASILEPPEETHFPTLEELIESDDATIHAFAEEMGEVCTQLDELIEKRSGRIKQEAQNARAAYEHIFSLIDYLLEIKAGLLEIQQGGGGES